MQVYLFQEHIASRHLVDSCQCVLHYTHDGPVGLWCHYHTWYSGQLTDLSASLQRLSQMQVHLVAVKVSVVWRRHTANDTDQYKTVFLE